jgi:dephospho-CoA kinase
MLRVGLTGDLGSGKTTVGKMLAARGAVVLSSDEMARALQQPGQPVFDAIVKLFGSSVVAPDGKLDRRELSRLAFNGGRIDELNAIVHPAVLAEQARQIAALGRKNPKTIVVVESALMFTTKYTLDGQPWQERFDRIILVLASSSHKLSRFVERMAQGRGLENDERAALEADARRRLAAQQPAQPNAQPPADGCLLIHNDGDLEFLEEQVAAIWPQLQTHIATK